MRVSEGMSSVVLTVGPDHSIREAAKQMAKRGTGGILTERDILLSLAKGEDPDTERVGEHLSDNLTFAAPDWSLERAAEAMVRGGFRHLVVVDGGETVGVLSMRDIVRCWTDAGATVEVDTARSRE